MYIFTRNMTDADRKVLDEMWHDTSWSINVLLGRYGSVAYNDVGGAALSANVGGFYNDWMASNTTIYPQNSCQIWNIAAGLKVHSGVGDIIIDNDPYSSLDFLEDRSGNAEFYLGAGNDGIHNNNSSDSKIIAGDGDNTIQNMYSNRVLIVTGTGNDSVWNFNAGGSGYFLGRNVTIQTGAGDDTILNTTGDYVTIDAGEGNDKITNSGDYVTIDAGDGQNTVKSTGNEVMIKSAGNNSSINSGDGKSSIDNGEYSKNGILNNGKILGSSTTIQAGKGDDFINNIANAVSINAGDGNNNITNGFYDTTFENITEFFIEGSMQLPEYIFTLAKKSIEIPRGDSTTIISGNGEDIIVNLGSYASISAGAGNDNIISSNGEYNIINGEGDNDKILVHHDVTSLILGGEGNDEIEVTRFYAPDFVDFGTVVLKEIGDAAIDKAKETLKNMIMRTSAAAALSKNPYVTAGVAAFSLGWEIGSAIRDFFNTRQNLIEDFSASSSIIGGKGDDTVICDALAPRNFYYNNGDGNDVIQGFSNSMLAEYISDILVEDIPLSTLHIESGEIDSVTVEGSDVILNIGEGSIKLEGGVSQKFNLKESDGTLTTRAYGKDAATGELICSIWGAAADEVIKDSINPENTRYALYGYRDALGMASDISTREDGKDKLYGNAKNDTLYGGEEDSLYGEGGNDELYGKNNSLLDGGAGNDIFYSGKMTAYSAYKDIPANGNKNTIYGGSGNDIIYNYGKETFIDGGDNDDQIYIYGEDTMLDGVHYVSGGSVTINGGAGNDEINISNANNNVITYTNGDGNDIVYGFNETSKIKISGAEYSTSKSGNDFIIKVGNGSITLKDAANISININGQKIQPLPEGLSIDGNKLLLSKDFTGNVLDVNEITHAINIIDAVELLYGIKIFGNSSINLFKGSKFDDVYYCEMPASNNSFVSQNVSEIENPNTTINGGGGNDTFYGGERKTLYQYAAGDGNDIIYGFKATDTLQISGGEYSKKISDNDVIVSVGEENIILRDAANLANINIDGTEKLINQWTLNGTTATYGTTAETLITLTGVKSVDGINLNDKVVTVSNSALNEGTVIISNGYTLKLADDVAKSSTTDAAWEISGTTAIYKAAAISAGYELSSDGKTINYNNAGGGDTLFTVTGLKEGLLVQNGVIAGIVLENNVVHVSEIVIGSELQITGAGYTLSIMEDEQVPDAISIKKDVATASNKFTEGAINLNKAWASNVTKVDASALSNAVEITGNAENNSIKGGKGADTISGGAGNDTLTGSAGKDVFIYSSGNDVITDYKAGEDIISASYTSSTLKGSDVILTTANGTLTVKGIKDKIITFDDGSEKIFYADVSYTPLETGLTYDAKRTVLTASNKFTGNELNLANYLSSATKLNASALSQALEITGNAENNSMKGGKAADTISGGAGNDTLTGGAGKDVFIYSSGNDVITDYKAGEDIISASYTSSTLKGSDVILTTDSGTLTVKGIKDKIITFDDGSEKIFYADVSYTPLETGLTYDSKRTVLTASNKFTGDKLNLANYLSSATKLNASALSQALEITGNAENNSMKGGKGADTISGGSGNDTLSGGAGKDVFIYSSGNDVITDYKAGEDIISASYTSSTLKGSDVILTTANGTLTVKGIKDKIITFDDGSEKIFYADVSYTPLETGLTYDAKRTVLTASNKFTGNELNLANYLSSATKLNASALSQALEITGNAENNSMKGGKGADTLNGGAGNDTLTGGAGKDVFIYSSGNDVITDYKAGEDIISASYTSSTLKGSDVILTTDSGTLTVKGIKDKIITFDDGSEKIFYADVSYTPLETGLTYDAKRTVLTASNKFTGDKLNLANYLSSATKLNASALSQAVEITGNAENNSMKGGKGADTILGGRGNDTLSGGAGKDVFIYSSGNDLITDYAEEDEIKINGTISETSYNGKNVIFTVGDGSLTVQNGKGKNISVTDSSSNAKTFDLFEDNNFISDVPQISDITEQKFSVTQIQTQTPNYSALVQNNSAFLTFAKK